jgi:hypothetical protein
MLFSAIVISIMMLTLLVANPQNTISQIISFSGGSLFFFNLCWYYFDLLPQRKFCCIILCIFCRLLCYVVTDCENLLVVIHIVMAKWKCRINDNIKSEYPFIKGVNENHECTLCNAKFCTAHGGQSDIVNHMKTKIIQWQFKKKHFIFVWIFLSTVFLY